MVLIVSIDTHNNTTNLRVLCQEIIPFKYYSMNILEQ